MLGPIINGENVRLAPPPSDFAEIFLSWAKDPDMARYIVPNPLSLQQEREWLEGVARNENMVYWVIWLGDEPIGSSAITGIDWRHRRAETGSFIGLPQYRERGYGGEAMQLRTRYAFEELGLEKLMAGARADNARSIRGLMRAGYREVGVQRHHLFHEGRWYDAWLGEVLRDEWLRDRQEQDEILG